MPFPIVATLYTLLHMISIQYLMRTLNYNTSFLAAECDYLASVSAVFDETDLPRPSVTRTFETVILQKSLKCGLNRTGRYPNPVSLAQVQVHIRLHLLLTCRISRHSLTMHTASSIVTLQSAIPMSHSQKGA
jgi:hypothetical protein